MKSHSLLLVLVISAEMSESEDIFFTILCFGFTWLVQGMDNALQFHKLTIYTKEKEDETENAK